VSLARRGPKGLSATSLQFIAGTLQRIEQDMRQHTGAIIRALKEVRDEIKKV
jgi:hypothetical protein